MITPKNLIPPISAYDAEADFVGVVVKCYNNLEMLKIYKFKKGFFVRIGKRPKRRDISKGSIDSLNLIRSIQRTKTVLHDYCLENNFEFFVTFTFADQRDNQDLCRQNMQKFLRKISRYTPISYLIVPEFHKDGESLHFHMLIAGVPLSDLVLAKYPDGNQRTSKRGNPLYTHPLYEYGFNHWEEIKSLDAKETISDYISKYIVKDMPRFFGKKRYWCSRNLNKPESLHFPYLDLSGISDAYIIKDGDDVTIFEVPIDEFTDL